MIKIKDPKVRPDGLCANPDCLKELPPVAKKYGDPFCSNACCRAWYDNPLPDRDGSAIK